MIFQRRGSHSSVLDTTSPSLRSRAPPHLPQTHGAGSTTRSTGRLSGSLRGPRGARRRGALAVSGAAISALASSSACVSSRSSIASSSCSTRSLPRSDDWPKGLAARLGQLQLQPLDLQGANFGFVLRWSAPPPASISRWARIIACALARSSGRSIGRPSTGCSRGLVTPAI